MAGDRLCCGPNGFMKLYDSLLLLLLIIRSRDIEVVLVKIAGIQKQKLGSWYIFEEQNKHSEIQGDAKLLNSNLILHKFFEM